jgi:toxin ParE1/3/4
MSRYEFAVEAAEDLESIYDFISRDSPARADRFVRRLEVACQRLADMPGMGRAWPNLGPNVRKFPFGEYLIYYRPSDGGIEVVRVLHGARDIRRAFRQPPGP